MEVALRGVQPAAVADALARGQEVRAGRLVGADLLGGHDQVEARREVPARRWSLPPAARFALFVLAPVLAVGAPLLVSYGEELGSLRRLLLLSGFVAAERSAFLLLHGAASRRIARGVGLLLLAAGIVGGALVLRPASAELSRLGRGVLLPDALALLQRVTDVDADGFSSMYGYSAARDAGFVVLLNGTYSPQAMRRLTTLALRYLKKDVEPPAKPEATPAEGVLLALEGYYHAEGSRNQVMAGVDVPDAAVGAPGQQLHVTARFGDGADDVAFGNRAHRVFVA